MKKLLCVIFSFFAILSMSFATPTKGNDTHSENWANITYYTVPIYKILDSSDAYVVIYAKNDIGVGQCVIPKSWAKYSKDSPRKLQIRTLRRGKLKSYLAVFKKDGEFCKAILNVPQDKSDHVWGVVKQGQQVEGADKDTLEDLPL